ncbi:uncharacterized protein LOC125055183 [Pieris napi]|uniref:uncharacterized protein LOC125055183 n=1 Tax=Pieris napi TaxID=78633 RepID=UPI001FB8700D|nr:uncharacterized protein LOC125055183 [Pieris napi]
MDEKQEYHDPDYPEAPVCVKEEPPMFTEEERISKICQIVQREFTNEVQERENEVTLIDQRMSTARRYLHQLRYTLVNNYYKEQKLQLSYSHIADDIAAQTEPRAKSEVAHLLRDSQRRLHPSLRKLLGKKTADLDEIFKFRGPRNSRKDYSAMVQTRNYTISADSTKSLRPEGQEPPIAEPSTTKPKKIPRHIEPKVENVVTLHEATRNKMKHRYRIIIGNTSKYAPPASRMDKSTHKWLLYVRGPPNRPDLSSILTELTARLHHSYAPHHIVTLRKPPFHISRRGWGEFPVKLDLHFPHPEMNRPTTVTHNIKLDRQYTGLQTLGAETVVDVWLYSTPDMIKFEYKDDDTHLPKTDNHTDTQANTETDTQAESQDTGQCTEIKEEPPEFEQNENDNWLDFFEKPTAVSVDEMIIKDIKKEDSQESSPTRKEVTKETLDESSLPIDVKRARKKRIMKYMDPKTGKIYYLEMDRELDLTKVQEIVFNSKGNVQTAKISPIKSNGLKKVRRGVSLLKPEVKNLQKIESLPSHIENDHCYLGYNFYNRKRDTLLDDFKKVIPKFRNVRQTVSYLLKKIPLISGEVKNNDFVKCFPFVVENSERYWKLDFAKRRNIEWSRAKLINKLLMAHYPDTESIWRTKQILIFARLHGYYPIRLENMHSPRDRPTDDWCSWNDIENNRKLESNIKEMFPSACDVTSLSKFDVDSYKVSDDVVVSDSDEEIDVLSDKKVKVRSVSETEVSLSALPVDSDDRLRFLYIERMCADIGIELRNEDVGNGYSYSAVHAVMLSAMRSFADQLVRDSLAVKLMEGASSHHPPPTWSGSSSRIPVQLEHVYRAASRLPHVANTALGTTPKQTYTI